MHVKTMSRVNLYRCVQDELFIQGFPHSTLLLITTYTCQYLYAVLTSTVLNRLKDVFLNQDFVFYLKLLQLQSKGAGIQIISTPSAAGTLQAVCVGKTLSHTAAQWRQPVSLWGIKALAT